MARQGGQELTLREPPQPYGLILRSGGQSAPIGAKRYTHYLTLMARQGGQELTLWELPQPYGLILGSSGEDTPIGTKRYTDYSTLMVHRSAQYQDILHHIGR